ncbi:MAG: hypothetical protein JMN26_17715, partial [gamma proteobacterium endosymbiont of Lamellibrachia anaximandri]|nr:hypothetical protein [gamma proteobacterium endosymbiont of Lamellibrachia anaximandri]
MKANNRESQRRIAYEAARILTELRSGDYNYACQKAADRLGLGNKRLMPNRDEIESALREQQRLFRGEDQATALQHLRSLAMGAMGALARFKPLLVGPVFDGTADQNSPIRLHLRCQPWRAKRRLVVPGSREAALLTRRALRQRGSKVGIRARRPV